MSKIKLTQPKMQKSLFMQLNLEYKALKLALFGNNTFVVLDESDKKVIRYNQLFQYFYPNFRTAKFVNPLTVLTLARKQDNFIDILLDRSMNCRNDARSLRYFRTANYYIDKQNRNL